MAKRPTPGSPITPTAQKRVLSSGRSPITPARRVALADGDVRPMTDDEVRGVEAALARQNLGGGAAPDLGEETAGRPHRRAARGLFNLAPSVTGMDQYYPDRLREIAASLGARPAAPDLPSAPPLSDTLAHAHARDTGAAQAWARDRVEVPVNHKLVQMRDDLVTAQKAGSVSNWEVAMIESMIDLRDLQDVIDAMTARQDVIRENVKLALANGDSKTFKCILGAATLAKGAETVSIVDPKLVPSQFLKTEIDKAKVGRALKVPSVVPGAVLTEGKPSLRITWDDE